MSVSMRMSVDGRPFGAGRFDLQSVRGGRDGGVRISLWGVDVESGENSVLEIEIPVEDWRRIVDAQNETSAVNAGARS